MAVNPWKDTTGITGYAQANAVGSQPPQQQQRAAATPQTASYGTPQQMQQRAMAAFGNTLQQKPSDTEGWNLDTALAGLGNAGAGAALSSIGYTFGAGVPGLGTWARDKGSEYMNTFATENGLGQWMNNTGTDAMYGQDITPGVGGLAGAAYQANATQNAQQSATGNSFTAWLNAALAGQMGTQSALDQKQNFLRLDAMLNGQSLDNRNQGATLGASKDKEKLNLALAATGDAENFNNRNREFAGREKGLGDEMVGYDRKDLGTKYAADQRALEDQYVAGGGWFAPERGFKKNDLASYFQTNNGRLDNQLGRNQLGYDRSMSSLDNELAQINRQRQGYNIDLRYIDPMLANQIQGNAIGAQGTLSQIMQNWGDIDAAKAQLPGSVMNQAMNYMMQAGIDPNTPMFNAPGPYAPGQAPQMSPMDLLNQYLSGAWNPNYQYSPQTGKPYSGGFSSFQNFGW